MLKSQIIRALISAPRWRNSMPRTALFLGKGRRSFCGASFGARHSSPEPRYHRRRGEFGGGPPVDRRRFRSRSIRHTQFAPPGCLGSSRARDCRIRGERWNYGANELAVEQTGRLASAEASPRRGHAAFPTNFGTQQEERRIEDRRHRCSARSLGVLQQDRRRAGGAGQARRGAQGYRDSLAITERLAKADPSNTGWQRDLSVSYNKIGDVLVAQGKLDEALTAYRDSLAIAERLRQADPGNAGWQRDLSVSYDRVGDVLVAQGKLDEALESLSATASPSASAWPRPTPATPAGSAISRCPTTRSATCWSAQGKLDEALEGASATASPSASAWPRPTPATPAGSAISRCPTTRSATCWWRRASSTEALTVLPRQPRHSGPPRQGRPRQRRLAARPLGVVRQQSAS